MNETVIGFKQDLITNYLKAAEKAKLPPESDDQKRIELMKSENIVGPGKKNESAQHQALEISRMEFTINNSSDVGDDSVKEDIGDPN